MLLATSLAACTKCLFATGLAVLLLATLQALHSTLVCLAMTVAAAKTCCWLEAGLRRFWHAMEMAWRGGGGGGRRKVHKGISNANPSYMLVQQFTYPRGLVLDATYYPSSPPLTQEALSNPPPLYSGQSTPYPRGHEQYTLDSQPLGLEQPSPTILWSVHPLPKRP